jgi:hypothetical protein
MQLSRNAQGWRLIIVVVLQLSRNAQGWRLIVIVVVQVRAVKIAVKNP